MAEREVRNPDVLVTGGTSGLGLELVRVLITRGYGVVATGRRQVNVNDLKGRFTLYSVDFANLGHVASTARMIFREHPIGTIVNNAGILSPASYTETPDGLEYSFQINFLAHLLINEIFLNSLKDAGPVRIATVSSPVYRMASLKTAIATCQENYNPIRAYSSSKLFQALMHEFLYEHHKDVNLECFSFNPGTFSSGISRMQESWFRIMYRIAAPFMRHPERAAEALADLLMKEEDVVSGKLYNIRKRSTPLPEMDNTDMAVLVKKCYSLIDTYLI